MDLQRLQRGVNPADFKPMLGIGAGAYELRIQLKGQWRLIYVAKFESAIYVLHSFHKKTQQTATKDIELARQRYKQVEAEQ
jgi:phage-related protein